MRQSSDLSSNLFSGKNYKICLIDVNSMFLFSGKTGIMKMYEFLHFLRTLFPGLLFINVIDNGISNRVLIKYPYYKAHRNHSIQSDNITVNKFSSVNSFKHKISQIHKIDGSFKNNLTFYLPGESDFKIGYILKYIYNNTTFNKDNILTLSIDKDFLMVTLLSDLLIKKSLDKSMKYFLIDNDISLPLFKKVFKIDKLNINNPYWYFYFLILNGDREDNIKQLFTRSETINIINSIIEKENSISINYIINYICEKHGQEYSDLIKENLYLVDLFNDDVFSTTEKNMMNYLLNNFFKTNNVI